MEETEIHQPSCLLHILLQRINYLVYMNGGILQVEKN
jgi:hypothetical protein